MVRRTNNTASYWIELQPDSYDVFFSFYNSHLSINPKHAELIRNFFTLTVEGTICSSSTPKISIGTQITIDLNEVDQEDRTYGGLSKQKDKAQTYIYIYKEYFFTICDYIKIGKIKYIRLFGEELFRRSALIYDIVFTSSIAEEGFF